MSPKSVILIIVASITWIFNLDGGFVFDDSEAVVKNKDVTSDSWLDPFYSDYWGADIKSNFSHKSYRPLTVISFRVDYWLNKKTLSPFHFKATNLICHIIVCFILWSVYEVLLNGRQKILTPPKNKKWWNDTAYLSTLLFMVHPIHVEAVTGIVGRADLLAAMTFLLAFLCYNKAMTGENYWYVYLFLTAILSGISMLCKENGITVLGFCLVYELINTITIKRKEQHYKKLDIRRGRYKILIGTDTVIRVMFTCLVIAGLLYGRWIVMGRTGPVFKKTENPAAFAKSMFTKVASYNYIYFLNCLLLIWPWWLCYDWSMGCIPLIKTVTDKRLILVLLMYIYGFLILRAIVRGKCRRSFNRKVIMAVALIVIPFLPASNIFYPVGFVIAERILYIPSAGYCLLVMIGYKKLLRKKSMLFSKFALFMFALLLMTFTLRSWQRGIEWHNEAFLFFYGTFVCPLNAKVHYNMAKAADAELNIEWAIVEYKEAIRLYPAYYQAMNNLANLLKNRKEYGKAEYYLRKAVKYKKNFPAAWMNLGIVLASTSRYEESEAAYKTAISYRNKYPDCYYNLGNLYLELNRTDDAIDSWNHAISLNKKHVLAWTNLLAFLDNTGQFERALKVIPTVLMDLPEAPSINFAIANMYGKLNRFSEAERYFKRAIRFFGKEVQAIHYANLGVLYHRWNKYDLAEEMYNNALNIDRTFKTARKNLENLRKIKD